MLDFRINAYKKFVVLNNPTFGPELKIDFNEINYYKKVVESIKDKISIFFIYNHTTLLFSLTAV